MRLQLTQQDTAKIRRSGGTGYVAVLTVGGPRGAKYRPVISGVFVTEAAAEVALGDLRRRFVGGKQLPLSARVVAVEAKLLQEVAS